MTTCHLLKKTTRLEISDQKLTMIRILNQIFTCRKWNPKFYKVSYSKSKFCNVTDFETKYYDAPDFETEDLQLFVNYLWYDKFWEKNFTTVWFFWTKVLQGVRIRFNNFIVCDFWNQYKYNVLDFGSIQLQDVSFWNKIFTTMFHFESKI